MACACPEPTPAGFVVDALPVTSAAAAKLSCAISCLALSISSRVAVALMHCISSLHWSFAICSSVVSAPFVSLACRSCK